MKASHTGPQLLHVEPGQVPKWMIPLYPNMAERKGGSDRETKESDVSTGPQVKSRVWKLQWSCPRHKGMIRRKVRYSDC